jgi:predicted ester cyclase
MSVNNKELVKRFFSEILTQKKTGVADEIFHPEFTHYSFPSTSKGPRSIKESVNIFISGFPDLKAYVEEAIAEGDTVSTKGYWTGSHKGEFMGIPPSGKNVNVKYIDMWKIKDGKLYESWVQMDNAGLIQQLGAIK